MQGRLSAYNPLIEVTDSVIIRETAAIIAFTKCKSLKSIWIILSPNPKLLRLPEFVGDWNLFRMLTSFYGCWAFYWFLPN